jgi:hypothetical protein
MARNNSAPAAAKVQSVAAERPPFPGARFICGFVPNLPEDGNYRYGPPEQPLDFGFPDPGNRTPHQPVVFVSQQKLDQLFNCRTWPSAAHSNTQPWFPPAGHGYRGPWHQPPPPGFGPALPEKVLTDADYYPGLTGDDLVKAWFTEVAQELGWKEVNFYGRSVLLVSHLVK